MKKELNRREFISSAAVSVGVIAAAKPQTLSISKRVLGKTGERVSILAFGGGSRFGRYERDEDAVAVVNEVIDSGVNYLDTAMGYGDGLSETRYGMVMKTRRKEVFLATKVPNRKYDEALRNMEQSLKRLQTDHVDLLHIHSLGKMDDLAEIEKPDGVLKAVYRIRDEGMARFIGITSHSDAQTMKTAIERHDFDCVQMALNPASSSFPWGTAGGFEGIALPAAREKGLGILAMKVAGQDMLVGSGSGKANIRDLLYYDMSLPVASCVIGMPTAEMMRENIQLARSFAPLSTEEKDRIRGQVKPSVAALHRFLANHRDECHV